jgi:DNA-binding MarR family transcriptional regulator
MPKINRIALKSHSRADAQAAPIAATLSATTSDDVLVGRELSTAIVLFHEAVATQLDMSAAEWKCFGLLDLHGPCTAGHLAKLSGFTTGAITGIVDRLERAGHVRRQPNPRDRRSTIIHPVDFRELRARVAPLFASLGKAMLEVCGHFTPQQLLAVQDYLRRTTQALRQETAKLASHKR